MSKPDFFGDWLVAVKCGDASEVDKRLPELFGVVARVAKKKLSDRVRQPRNADEEDCAISVLDSFVQRVQEQNHSCISEDGLWAYLMRMTHNKVLRIVNDERRQKRGRGNVRGESVFERVDAQSDAPGLEQFADFRELEPAYANVLSEGLVNVFAQLTAEQSEALRLHLDGLSKKQIAEQMGVVERTVDRWMGIFRATIKKQFSL